jgi:APA family basic amino acid/polyamine antiporter
MSLGVVVVTLVYILTSAVFLYLVPPERVTSGETFAAQAGEILFGRVGAGVFAGVVVIAVLGSLASVMMAAPRVYYAMARDGVFFSAVASLHPRYHTPARAIACQAALASLLVVLGTFEQIVAYFVFVTVVFIALTVATVFKLPQPDSRVAGYPLTPIVFLTLVGVLLLLLGGRNPMQALVGVVLTALGVPVYRLVFAPAGRK